MANDDVPVTPPNTSRRTTTHAEHDNDKHARPAVARARSSGVTANVPGAPHAATASSASPGATPPDSFVKRAAA